MSYGLTEWGERLHILREAPRAWCGEILVWIDPPNEAPGSAHQVCRRCQKALRLAGVERLP